MEEIGVNLYFTGLRRDSKEKIISEMNTKWRGNYKVLKGGEILQKYIIKWIEDR